MSEPTFAEIKKAFEQRERIFQQARERRNEALALLQEECPHLTVVGGNENYGDVDWRVCVTCGLTETRGYNDDGDDYYHATRAHFVKMPIYLRNRVGGYSREGTIAYEPASKNKMTELIKFGKHKI